MPTKGHSIRVAVTTAYLDEQSEPHKERFVFSYTIVITNNGSEPARLMTRHWIITDANGKIEEVRGDGVVGQQPRLMPGQQFKYSSGAVLDTPVGVMEGSYHLVADSGEAFSVPIAPFSLAIPGILH
jgi:ApaG protein